MKYHFLIFNLEHLRIYKVINSILLSWSYVLRPKIHILLFELNMNSLFLRYNYLSPPTYQLAYLWVDLLIFKANLSFIPREYQMSVLFVSSFIFLRLLFKIQPFKFICECMFFRWFSWYQLLSKNHKIFRLLEFLLYFLE